MESKENVVERETVNFLSNKKVRVSPIKRKNPFANFSLEELNASTGKYETVKDVPEQLNKTKVYISVPFDNKTKTIKRIFDNVKKVYTEQYPHVLLTEQEFFETTLNLEKGYLDPAKTAKDDKGTIRMYTNWNDSLTTIVLENSPLDLDLSNPLDMLKYKVLLSNSNHLIATDRSLINSNPTYKYVIIDIEEEMADEIEKDKIKLEAMEIFIDMSKSKDIQAMSNILSLYEGKWQIFDKYDISQKRVLEKLEKDPYEFIKVTKDPRKTVKLLLYKAVKYSEIRPLNGRYKLVIEETDLGTMPEALNWLENDDNFGIVEKLKTRLNKMK